MAKIDQQQAELNKTKKQQGFIGKSWDWFKNKTGIGDGSDKAQKQQIYYGVFILKIINLYQKNDEGKVKKFQIFFKFKNN